MFGLGVQLDSRPDREDRQIKEAEKWRKGIIQAQDSRAKACFKHQTGTI